MWGTYPLHISDAMPMMWGFLLFNCFYFLWTSVSNVKVHFWPIHPPLLFFHEHIPFGIWIYAGSSQSWSLKNNSFYSSSERTQFFHQLASYASSYCCVFRWQQSTKTAQELSIDAYSPSLLAYSFLRKEQRIAMKDYLKEKASSFFLLPLLVSVGVWFYQLAPLHWSERLRLSPWWI